MGDAQFQQPYTTEEIERRPYAVLISLLIGLLLMVISGAVYDHFSQSQQIHELTTKADDEKAQRIKMYERMIFYKNASSASDSTLREQTSPYIQRILKQH